MTLSALSQQAIETIRDTTAILTSSDATATMKAAASQKAWKLMESIIDKSAGELTPELRTVLKKGCDILKKGGFENKLINQKIHQALSGSAPAKVKGQKAKPDPMAPTTHAKTDAHLRRIEKNISKLEKNVDKMVQRSEKELAKVEGELEREQAKLGHKLDEVSDALDLALGLDDVDSSEVDALVSQARQEAETERLLAKMPKVPTHKPGAKVDSEHDDETERLLARMPKVPTHKPGEEPVHHDRIDDEIERLEAELESSGPPELSFDPDDDDALLGLPFEEIDVAAELGLNKELLTIPPKSVLDRLMDGLKSLLKKIGILREDNGDISRKHYIENGRELARENRAEYALLLTGDGGRDDLYQQIRFELKIVNPSLADGELDAIAQSLVKGAVAEVLAHARTLQGLH
jgi:hypothetical protein